MEIFILLLVCSLVYLFVDQFKEDRTVYKLTLQKVIRWEQLAKKPFSEFDNDNEQDVLKLLYVFEESDLLLADYLKKINAKTLQKKLKALTNHFSVIAQYQDSKEQSTDEEKEQTYFKDIVPTLILAGYDTDYLLNEALLSDLPMLMNGYTKKVKDEAESKRMWTYIQMSPHLSKPIKMTELIPLPWDKEEEMTEEDKEQSLEIFNSFTTNSIKI